MQTIENEIRAGKSVALRFSGARGEPLLKYPQDVARSLGLKAGHPFEVFFNHQGEVLFRPIPVAVEAAAAGGE